MASLVQILMRSLFCFPSQYLWEELLTIQMSLPRRLYSPKYNSIYYQTKRNEDCYSDLAVFEWEEFAQILNVVELEFLLAMTSGMGVLQVAAPLYQESWKNCFRNVVMCLWNTHFNSSSKLVTWGFCHSFLYKAQNSHKSPGDHISWNEKTNGDWVFVSSFVKERHLS